MSFGLSAKEAAELAFWQSRQRVDGRLANDHFEYFYTDFFGLPREFFEAKSLLDIGCGPRGSLEWAVGARCRIGLDPLAHAYTSLGIQEHGMTYIAALAEQMPFADESFDVVSSLNSLDHVDDLSFAIGELKRVVRSGGTLLILTDIHEQPTTLEPAAFGWDIIARFLPNFQIVSERRFEYTATGSDGFGDIYQSSRDAVPFDHENETGRYGILALQLLR